MLTWAIAWATTDAMAEATLVGNVVMGTSKLALEKGVHVSKLLDLFLLNHEE